MFKVQLLHLSIIDWEEIQTRGMLGAIKIVCLDAVKAFCCFNRKVKILTYKLENDHSIDRVMCPGFTRYVVVFFFLFFSILFPIPASIEAPDKLASGSILSG